MALTASQVKEHIQTDLSDTALNRLINAEYKRIDKVAGTSSLVEIYNAAGLDSVFTQRQIASITSIKERRVATSDQITLNSNDYRKLSNNKIMRLTDGNNPASDWGAEVEISYTSGVSDYERDNALIELVRVSVEHRAASQVSDGDYSASLPELDKARAQILSGITKDLGLA